MATYNASLSALTTFPFDTPDHWPKWRRRFEQYRLASGLLKEPEERQINTLLYYLGEEAEDILTSTNISERNMTVSWRVSTVSLKSEKNVIMHERAKFDKRSQLPDEPAEQFIASLYNLASDCNFGDLKNELIRDRIVVGIQDASLSERLQTEPELTLESKTLVRQREAVRVQQQTLKGEKTEAPSLVDAMSHKPNRKPSHHKSQRQLTSEPPKKCI